MTSSEPAMQLRAISGEAAVALAAWTDDRASRPLAPGKWSPKQALAGARRLQRDARRTKDL